MNERFMILFYIKCFKHSNHYNINMHVRFLSFTLFLHFSSYTHHMVNVFIAILSLQIPLFLVSAWNIWNGLTSTNGWIEMRGKSLLWDACVIIVLYYMSSFKWNASFYMHITDRSDSATVYENIQMQNIKYPLNAEPLYIQYKV